jgi:NADH dehydrogenase
VARVLVTGGTGFLGSALVPALLAAGHRPRVFARRAPASSPAGVEVAIGDLEDAGSLTAAVEGVDAVVHLGAATSAGRIDPTRAYRVNVGGASALLGACRAAGCRRIVAMSTQHVHLARPGVYGRTKRIADLLFADSGLDVTLLRPSLVYGPGRRGVFVKLQGLVRKLPVIPVVGPGRWRLRPLFLPDLIAIVLETLRRPELAGRSYDVGGPDLVSYDEFLEAICAALGRPCRRVHLPLSLSFALAWTLERTLANPPLTVENVHGAKVEAPCDLTALVRDFKPALTPLGAGLRQTLVAA